MPSLKRLWKIVNFLIYNQLNFIYPIRERGSIDRWEKKFKCWTLCLWNHSIGEMHLLWLLMNHSFCLQANILESIHNLYVPIPLTLCLILCGESIHFIIICIIFKMINNIYYQQNNSGLFSFKSVQNRLCQTFWRTTLYLFSSSSLLDGKFQRRHEARTGRWWVSW